MQLNVTETAPEWASQPGKTYETKFIYTGFGRIDTHKGMYQTFQDNPFCMFERPYVNSVISRAYNVELTTVTEYSGSPRRWKEETVGGTQYFEVRRNSQ